MKPWLYFHLVFEIFSLKLAWNNFKTLKILIKLSAKDDDIRRTDIEILRGFFSLPSNEHCNLTYLPSLREISLLLIQFIPCSLPPAYWKIELVPTLFCFKIHEDNSENSIREDRFENRSTILQWWDNLNQECCEKSLFG